MVVSNISCIGDLFENGFDEKLFLFIFRIDSAKILNYFMEQRYKLIDDYCKDFRNIRKISGMYFLCTKLELPEIYTNKLESNGMKLNFQEYHAQLFDFNQRELLYKYYSFSIKKNKLFYEKFIKPIIEFYFKQDKSYFLQNKTKLFLDEFIDKQLQNYEENELKRKKRFLKNKEFSDAEVRYLVLDDIFESLFLIDKKLVKQLKTTNNVVNYVCKKVLGETFDEDKQVEMLLKPKVSRTNTDVDTSNRAIYGYYKCYVKILDMIKEEIGVNYFTNLDYDDRKLYLNNLEIDEIYLEEYLTSIKIDEFSKPSKVIAYNILEYKYPELNRDDIRQRCSRAERNFVPQKRILNKLETLDLKLLEANNKIYYNKQELELTEKYLKKQFSA